MKYRFTKIPANKGLNLIYAVSNIQLTLQRKHNICVFTLHDFFTIENTVFLGKQYMQHMHTSDNVPQTPIPESKEDEIGFVTTKLCWFWKILHGF